MTEEFLSDLSRVEKLELDIDERMAVLRMEILSIKELPIDTNGFMEMLSRFARAAYGKGYCDALSEPREKRGQLLTDHGYKVPPLDTE